MTKFNVMFYKSYESSFLVMSAVNFLLDLKFSDVREFFKIPFGLNSDLLMVLVSSVVQLELLAAAADSCSWRSTLRSSSLVETVSRSRAWRRLDLSLDPWYSFIRIKRRLENRQIVATKAENTNNFDLCS